MYNMMIPLDPKEDSQVWNHSTTGLLSFLDAYSFTSRNPNHHVALPKIIRNKAVSHSHSTLIWNILKKMPIDDNLAVRGCYLPSMCSFCKSLVESTNHLLLTCRFTLIPWIWFQNIVKKAIELPSFASPFYISKRGWSQQCSLVIIATMDLKNIVAKLAVCVNSLSKVHGV